MSSDWGSDSLDLLGAEPEHDYLADVYDAAMNRFVRFAAQPVSDDLQGDGQTVAVVDTGLLSSHPDIEPRLAGKMDFTGEGEEDLHGHGTVVALLLLTQVPRARILNVKVLAKSKKNQAKSLLDAFEWLSRQEYVRVVNLSAGLTRPRCKGDCDVCEAARRLVLKGKMIVVAAGNLPGITSCPAKASDAVFTVTALDQHERLASYASPATKEGYAGFEPRVMTTWIDSSGQQIDQPT